MPKTINPQHIPDVSKNFSGPLLRGFLDDDIRNFFKRSERPIDYLYRDSEGYPTIGVGHLVPNAASAIKLPLRYGNPRRGYARPATEDEIRYGYINLPAQTQARKKHTASHYNPASKNLLPLYLHADDIDQLLDQDIRIHRKAVAAKFPAFDDYPDRVRKALLDMQFNMGGNFNAQKWPKFWDALARKDWEGAAHESGRPQIGFQRNEEIKELFLSA